MIKGKSTWKYNKLLTARRNYFLPGGALNSINQAISSPPMDDGMGGFANPNKEYNTSGPLPKQKNNGFLGLGLDFSNPFKGENTDAFKNALVKAAGSAIGNIGGGAIGGGFETGAGKALQGLSNLASAIPGPWGAVASAGLGVLGGLTNRMFGSKLNNENIDKVESDISRLNNFQSNASDYDALSQNWADANTAMGFSNS